MSCSEIAVSCCARLPSFPNPLPHPRLANAPEPMPREEAERRHVTVMFCGPGRFDSTVRHAWILEDLREVISAYQQCVAEIVRQLRRVCRPIFGRRRAGVFWLSAGA